MTKKYHALQQGTDEWKAYRSTKCNASDAPAMLDLSQYKSRDALMRAISTGEEEIISPSVQKIFDDGHRFEKMARPFAEEIIGQELFSPTISLEVDGVELSASFDGATMMEDVIWEHKTLNKKLVVDIPNGIIDPMYQVQMEQQLIISGAEKCLFMASKGIKETMVHIWYRSNPNLRQRIIAGWKQFAIDLESYVPVAEVITPEAKPIESLPSLQIMVTGAITNSNLDVYHKSAITFIDSINTDLQTDEDFANAEKTAKFLKNAEVELQNVKKQIFSQTADIEKAVTTIDHIFETSRVKRLSLEKLVKSQKEVRKAEIINEAKTNFDDYINALLSELKGQTFNVHPNFIAAIKSKRTIEAIRNAVNTELAKCKIEANEVAGLIRANLNTYGELASEHQFLFNDLSGFIQKQPDDFKLLVESRVNQHKQAEKEKLEKQREQMRLEEEIKAKKKIDDENERKRIEAENIKIVEQRKQEAAEKELTEKIDAVELPEKTKPSEAPQAEEPVQSTVSKKSADTGNESKAASRTVKKPIPTSGQIVDVLANHFNTDGEIIIGWLQNINFQQLFNKYDIAS